MEKEKEWCMGLHFEQTENETDAVSEKWGSSTAENCIHL